MALLQKVPPGWSSSTTGTRGLLPVWIRVRTSSASSRVPKPPGQSTRPSASLTKNSLRKKKKWNDSRLPVPCTVAFFRIKNEGTNRITGARDKASGVIPGVADSCLLVPGGKAVFIEFKTESGKQSPVQSDWQAKVQGAWFRYEVVRSLDEFQTLIANLLT